MPLRQLLQHLPSLKYLMVGAFCALLNLAIQTVAALFFGAHYVVSTLLAFVVLVPLSFYIHKHVTFPGKARVPAGRFILYSAQWIVLLGVHLALMALLVDLLHLPLGAAIVLVTAIIHVMGFLYSRNYVFRRGTVAE